MARNKKAANKGLVITLFILIAIFLALVAILLAVVFSDGMKSGQFDLTPSPEATSEAVPTKNAENTKKPATPTSSVKTTATTAPTATYTPIPTDTPTPTPTEAPSVMSNMSSAVDVAASAEYNELSASGAHVTCEFKDAGYYVSALFTVTKDGVSTLVPVVYVKETGEEIKGSAAFRESYLAVVKERLQEYVKDVDDVLKKSDFVKYSTPYRAEDYDMFYIDGDKVVFCFGENSLIDTPHKSFTYSVDLSEAEPFLYVKTSGESTLPDIRTDLDPTKPMVAFTYDDGAYAFVEERLLELFKQYDARATFFTLGNRVHEWDGYYDVTLRALCDIGCEISSHTYGHYYFYDESYFDEEKDLEKYWQEINKSTMAIAEITGRAPSYIRMPGGCYSAYMENSPYPMINWSVDTHDWDKKGRKEQKKVDGKYVYDPRNEQETYEVLMKAKDGDIVLMHSLYHWSYDATERAMAELSAKGYQFVTVSELFYYKGITPENGVLYTKGY